MRVQAKKLNGASVAPVAASEGVPPEERPIVIPDITLRLSPRDLWFITIGMSMTPWGGGEQRVTHLHAIHKVLRLDRVNRNLPIAKVATAPVEVVTLPHAHVELIIRVLCGEGDRAFNGESGPMMAALVIRLREVVKDAIKAAAAARQRETAKA